MKVLNVYFIPCIYQLRAKKALGNNLNRELKEVKLSLGYLQLCGQRVF